ncbi:MAG: GNAT family N-acetyltransferase [Chitinophagaceae bacterium]
MILLALAIAPAIAIIMYILAKDKYNREPFKNLLISFLLGGVSTIPAIIIQVAFEGLSREFLPKDSMLYYAFFAFVVVAMSEEGSKLFMLRYYAFPKPAFDEPLDGIIYGVLVAMGFATVENIMYVFQNGVGTAITRAFLSVPAHAAFGVMMGYYVGLAKFDHQNMRALIRKGLFMAVLFHGSFDFFLFLQAAQIDTFLPSGLLTFGSLASLYFAIRFSRRSIHLHQEMSRIDHEKNRRLAAESLTVPEPGDALEELQVRAATVDDIPVIRRLAIDIWPMTYSHILTQDQIGYMLHLFYSERSLLQQMQSHQFFLGFYQDHPVAFASVGRTTEEGVFKLHKLYLSTGLQGKGMGRFLLNYIIGVIKSYGATDLELNVNRQNKALGFYQALGFGIIKTEDIDIGEGFWMNDYVLRKLL